MANDTPKPIPAPAPAPAPPAPPPNVFYINYFDQIAEPQVKALMGICTQIVTQKKPDVLYFLFSSPGGSVNAGITFYNFLRSLPAEIVMHNTGSIDSVATVVFLAGDRRYAAKHSSFLFHGIQRQVGKETRWRTTDIKEQLSGLELNESKLIGIISDRCELTEGEIRDLFQQGESKDLAFALEKKIINEIKNPQIPKGAQFASVNVN
jgi:ATP-dependent Clp protease, protease subunit